MYIITMLFRPALIHGVHISYTCVEYAANDICTFSTCPHTRNKTDSLHKDSTYRNAELFYEVLNQYYQRWTCQNRATINWLPNPSSSELIKTVLELGADCFTYFMWLVSGCWFLGLIVPRVFVEVDVRDAVPIVQHPIVNDEARPYHSGDPGGVTEAHDAA